MSVLRTAGEVSDETAADKWKKRLAAKEAELAAAKAELTEDDKEELEGRVREAELESQIREARRKKRDLAMARAIDAWREKLSAGGKRAYVDGLTIDGREDFFIVSANKVAQEALTAQINHPRTKPNDLVKIYLNYALLVVKQWNDVDTSSNTSTGSMDLRRFLEENPGVVSSIAKEASRLAGAHAEDHKS